MIYTKNVCVYAILAIELTMCERDKCSMECCSFHIHSRIYGDSCQVTRNLLKRIREMGIASQWSRNWYVLKYINTELNGRTTL